MLAASYPLIWELNQHIFLCFSIIKIAFNNLKMCCILMLSMLVSSDLKNKKDPYPKKLAQHCLSNVYEMVEMGDLNHRFLLW